ncbi:MAG: sodium:alanine symporter family protein [Peptococcaceae bacterium]|nr:sodium:alanine symporter family protein [Peptococcaceae bacterium]
METFMELNNAVNGFVWGPIMLALLIGTGLYLTVRGGFIQFTHFGYVLKRTMGGLFKGHQRTSDGNNISSFQAVSTALASTVGTGNIVGVATAITIGGPGAVFWMWISALLGMMTKYSEIVLAVKFREVNDEGQHIGGPMYYLKNGVGAKHKTLGTVVAAIFAVFAALACFGIGNMTQGNSIASSMQSTFGISTSITGIVLAIIVAIVILGGINSIARITEMFVPVMAVFYLVLGVVILILHAQQIPVALSDIFVGAFNPEAVLGGGAGVGIMMAIQMGFARGVFSNEAGLGSAPIAHAASSTKDPVEQGLWGIFEVFVDTILVCTMTALIILTTTDPSTGNLLWADGNYDGASLTLKAFEFALPGTFGSICLSIAMLFFAFSTMIGWSYYGEKAWEYLFRNNAQARKTVTFIFRICFIIAVYIGATGGLEFVWGVADTLNGCMAIPNLIGVILLSGIVLQETKRYFSERDK